MSITATALAALLMASAQAGEAASTPAGLESAALEADQLAKGRAANANAALEKHVAAAPEDPAL